MNGMMSLGEVFDRVDNLSRACWDTDVKVKEVSFASLDHISIKDEPYRLTPLAQTSMAYRLGVPVQYLRRCPPDVQAYNLNHWITKEPHEELFFRFDGETVRAIFTPKYTPVDNFEILERLDALGYHADTPVQCHLDEEFMLLNLPDEKDAFVINGDKMTPGISISNSEVGLASLSISAFVLRLICTNGMVARTEVSASYRHVSRKILDEFPGVLASVVQQRGTEREQLKVSLQRPIGDIQATIEGMNRHFQLGKDEQEAITWAWPLEQGESMFHLVNAYTRAAQKEGLPTVSRYRLQTAAGQILEMVKDNRIPTMDLQ